MATLVSGTHKTVLFLAVGVILSRLPFIGHGFGTDPDAWRAVTSAEMLLETGVYVPSRPPGYPLTEFVLAGLFQVGLVSSIWMGLIATALSAAAVVLVYLLFQPLGEARALVAALALALTPAAYVAGLGAMDYLWGLTFILAAAMCAARQHVWPACLLLGFAAAARPTNALAVIGIVLLLAVPWKRLIWPLAGALVVAVAFYTPEFVSLGWAAFRTADSKYDILQAVNFATVGLFGAAGTIGVAIAIWSAVRNRKPRDVGDVANRMNRWAIANIATFGLLFLVLPHESGYLIPALPALYWLICRDAGVKAMWAMIALLLVSCFVIKVDGEPGRVEYLRGPVLWEVEEQNERECIAHLVQDWLSTNEGYVVVGYRRPQIAEVMDADDADRVMYTVRPHNDGLRDNEFRFEAFPKMPSNPSWLPPGSNVWVLDRAVDQQRSVWPQNTLPVLPSTEPCR